MCVPTGEVRKSTAEVVRLIFTLILVYLAAKFLLVVVCAPLQRAVIVLWSRRRRL